MSPELQGEDLDRLRYLADLNGVSTFFWDWSGKHRQISSSTLLRVLQQLEVPVSAESDRAALEAAIEWTDRQPWLQTLPDCLVVRRGDFREVPVHLPHGHGVRLLVVLEGDGEVELEQLDRWVPPHEVDGRLIGRATFEIPGDLPLGYHHLRAEISMGTEVDVVVRPFYVVPQRLESPALAMGGRFWGVNAQAYSVRSRGSWGVGDSEDLADLTAICADEGANFILINPLHAAEPVSPIEESPYLPVSRRWLNVLYIRPEVIPEYAELGPRQIARIEQERQEAVDAPGNRGGSLNRDQSWESKRRALEAIFPVPRSIHREAEYRAFLARGGEDLRRFALWCSLAEHYGTTILPEEVETGPETPESVRLAEELASRIEFHSWCQWIAATQCRTPQRVAEALGMKIGIMSDLAVGVHGYGAEFWANRENFAADVSVGAPPDMYSQTGQNWSQPPWNPRVLERTGFAPLRDVLRATMALSGAIRIDHILGLFRLWWIPSGETADQGAYVSFNHEAMVGVVLLEAYRHGCVVIGEDLGTVEPWVRTYLADRGIMGTSVLWFEKDHSGWPLPADQYRSQVLATVNTHDLPPTAGYMEGIHTTLRERLGLLVESVEQVQRIDREEQERMLARLIEWGLASEASSPQEVLEALHRYICRTPSRLVAAALVDAVGEKQPQNLPGTHHEYPNWRIPLSDSEGKPIWIEELAEREDMRRLFAIMREEMGT